MVQLMMLDEPLKMFSIFHVPEKFAATAAPCASATMTMNCTSFIRFLPSPLYPWQSRDGGYRLCHGSAIADSAAQSRGNSFPAPQPRFYSHPGPIRGVK